MQSKQPQNTRDHILLTSLTLFLQKSFKEVTMKEIVDKTQLSKGAFYHYFSSKEQVFAEVIQHFFAGMMTINYHELPQNSLKEFYKSILASYEKNRQATLHLLEAHEHNEAYNNYYYLIFDAMRMLPDFKNNHLEQQKEELKAWTAIIAIAKKNKEIKTTLPNDQVARLFIYLSDGTNINLIISDQVNKKKNELKSLWEGLYESISEK